MTTFYVRAARYNLSEQRHGPVSHHKDNGPPSLVTLLDATRSITHVVLTIAAGVTNVHDRSPGCNTSSTGFKVLFGLLHYLFTVLDTLVVPPDLHLIVKVTEGLVVSVLHSPRDRFGPIIMIIGIVPMVQRIMVSSALMAQRLHQGMATLVLCLLGFTSMIFKLH